MQGGLEGLKTPRVLIVCSLGDTNLQLSVTDTDVLLRVNSKCRRCPLRVYRLRRFPEEGPRPSALLLGTYYTIAFPRPKGDPYSLALDTAFYRFYHLTVFLFRMVGKRNTMPMWIKGCQTCNFYCDNCLVFGRTHEHKSLHSRWELRTCSSELPLHI